MTGTDFASVGTKPTMAGPGVVRLARGSWLAIALVILLFCAPLFVGLGATDLGNDESIYSFAVDVMLRTGDWLTPKSSPSDQVDFLEKPPLKFWIVAAPIRLGLLPDNEFGLRFCDAVIGSLAFLYVFAIGRRLGGVACGLVAVLMLFVHRPLVFEHGLRSNNMEASLVLAYCGAVYHFLRWRSAEGNARRAPHVVAMGLFFVLGFMTKFVAIAFLPMVLGLVVLLRRADRRRFAADWKAWLASASVAVVLIAPWFLYQYHRVGRDLWGIMFGAHVYQRFTTYLVPEHVQPWHFYFSVLFRELQGSGALLVSAVGVALVLWRTLRQRWVEGAIVLLWFLLPLTLISAGSSKVYHYTYPFLPPLALCAGYVATVVVRALRRLTDPWLASADDAVGAMTARVVRNRLVQHILLGAGVACVALAIATWAAGGHLRVHVGSLVLFTNAGVLRPAIAALVALTLAGRLIAGVRLAVPLLLLLILPLGTYRAHLSLAAQEDRPLGTLRACLQPIEARHAPADDPRGLGVYVEHETASHAFHYYLGGLGRWFNRPGTFSDATVYTALYVPSLMRPVLLSTERYRTFTRLVDSNDAELLDRSARKLGMSPADLQAQAKTVSMSVVFFPQDVLLLPGPYSVCGLRTGTGTLR